MYKSDSLPTLTFSTYHFKWFSHNSIDFTQIFLLSSETLYMYHTIVLLQDLYSIHRVAINHSIKQNVINSHLHLHIPVFTYHKIRHWQLSLIRLGWDQSDLIECGLVYMSCMMCGWKQSLPLNICVLQNIICLCKSWIACYFDSDFGDEVEQNGPHRILDAPVHLGQLAESLYDRDDDSSSIWLAKKDNATVSIFSLSWVCSI